MQNWKARKVAQRAFPVMEKCEWCGETKRLQRHHPNIYKETEIIILCQKCHVKADQMHGTRKRKPMQKCVVCGKIFNPPDSHIHKTCSSDCLKIRGKENALKRWNGKLNQILEGLQ